MTISEPPRPERASNPDLQDNTNTIKGARKGAFVLNGFGDSALPPGSGLLSATLNMGSESGRHMAKKPISEHSELAGEFTDDGVTVLVDIFRPAGGQSDWEMEVVNQDDGLTTWDEKFATDRDAFDEFLAIVEREGIRTFLEDADPQIH